MASLTAKQQKKIDDVVIGIDLGTTFSCVAVWDDATGKVKVLPNAVGARTTPSFVAFTAQGRVVGQPAKDQAAINPHNTLYDVKRIIGRAMNDEVVQKEVKRFPFKVVNGGQDRPMLEVQWRGESRQLSPQEVSAMVLTELKRSAEVALGHPCNKAVITVPAHFNDQQRQATKDAGRIAGLQVLRIINEPTAAALAYGIQDKAVVTKEKGAKKKAIVAASAADEEWTTEVKTNVVIFDLGGGTFDVSVLTMEGGVFEVRATGGDTHLGGEDFDNMVVDWALAELGAAKGADVAAAVKANARAVRRLRAACESAKRLLSTATSAAIEVDNIQPDVDLSLTLTRANFEEINAPLFKRCMDTVASVLKDALVPIERVSDCVLVGGSTRVLALQDQLRAFFGASGNVLDLCRTVNPDEAVAVGAAVQGRILKQGGRGGGKDLAPGMSQDMLLLDVTPLSLGIELEGKQMSTLIKRNTPIPCRKARQYTTVGDYQTEIDVVIYEGERPNVDQNNKLGEFLISGVERAKAGEPKVEVTFALDANGILNVSARDVVTGAFAKAEIKADRGRLTDEEVERMVAEAETYRAQDDELATKVSLRNLIEEALYSATTAAKEAKKDDAVTELNEMRDWLDLDSDDAPLVDLFARAKILNDKHGAKIEGVPAS